MKKIVFSLGLVCLALCVSCEKDFIDESSVSRKTSFKILKYSDLNARGVENSILNFDSEADFEFVIDSLQSVFDSFEIRFSETHQHMSDEDLNSLIVSQGIDLFEPLTNFENHYSFYSLRNHVNNLEKEWLNQIDPDFNENPQVLEPLQNHVERALWNQKGEIMIEGKIYKYLDDKFIKIEDGDFDKLVLINAGDQAVLTDPNVHIEYLPQPISGAPAPGQPSQGNQTNLLCTNQRTNNHIEPGLNDNFRMQISNQLKPRSWFLGKHKMYATTYSYSKTHNGTIIHWTTNISVKIQGERFGSNGCGTSSALTDLTKTRRSNMVQIEFKRVNSFGVKYNSLWCSLVSIHQVTNPNPNGPQPFPNPLTLRYAW